MGMVDFPHSSGRRLVTHKILYLSPLRRPEADSAAAFLGAELVGGFPAASYGERKPTEDAASLLSTTPFPLPLIVLDRQFPLPQRIRALLANLRAQGVPLLAYRGDVGGQSVRGADWEEEWADTFADCGAECVDGPEELMARLKTLLPSSSVTQVPLALPGRAWLWSGSFECVSGGGDYTRGVGGVANPFVGGREARSLNDVVKVHGDEAAVRRAALRSLLLDQSTRWDEVPKWETEKQLNGIPMAMTDDDIASLLPDIEACIAHGGLQAVRGDAPWGGKPQDLANLELTPGQALLARVAHAVPDAPARWPEALRVEMHNLRERWEVAEEAIVAEWNRSWTPRTEYGSARHDEPHCWMVTRNKLEIGASPRNCLVTRGLVEPWQGEALPERLTDQDFARLSASSPAVVVQALSVTSGSVLVENVRRAVQRLVESWGDRAEAASLDLLPIMLNGVGRRKRLGVVIMDGVLGRKGKNHRAIGEGWSYLPRGWWSALTTLVPNDIGTKDERGRWISRALDRIAAPDPETAHLLPYDAGLRETSHDIPILIEARLERNGFFTPHDSSGAPWLAQARESERVRAAGSPVLASPIAVGHPRIGGRT